MRTVGFVLNPISGMGGRVGLKGTDGNVAAARARGAEPRAPDRAHEALAALAETDGTVRLLTYGEPMGERVARDAGFDPVVVGEPGGETDAEDTKSAVRAFRRRGVDIVLFVGGDGTAVDVAEVVGDTPMLGVPAGVKVYSAVFAVSPAAAGRIAATFEATETSEVNDIDEAAYRDGEVRTELKAVVTVPVAEERQVAKRVPGGSVTGLAEGFAEEIQADVTYVFGPGGTVGAIERELGFEGAPLGVDVWRDGDVLVRDASESAILDALGRENEIVVSPIGGQGFVFGRGNPQISPAVIRRSAVEIVASREKLAGVGVLRVDTGDPDLDDELRGWRRVRVGRYERQLVEIA